jgi:glycosyltransferase involved in cell wall biosynthesis
MLNHKDTRPLRVLHVVGESRFGGAATIILGLGEVAQAQGWQVDILTTDPLFQRAVRQRGMGLVDMDVIRRQIRPLWDVRGLVRLTDFLRSQRYDIVHTHTSKGGFVGRLAARLARVPVIVHTIHGFAFHEATPVSSRLVYTALERIASRWCDRIVSVSEFHRNWAIELGMCSPHRIVAIPNGIAELARNKLTGREELRRELGARSDDLLVLSMARLAKDKGLNYLVQAAAILACAAHRVRIVIAGDGLERERLQQLATNLNVTDRVTFAGFREDVGDLLAACDMVALPSLREGLSIALLEAMAAGKPIIASSIGSQKEVASRAEMALLVRPADVLSLSEAILRLAADPALRARLGRNARAVYETYYTEDRMLDSYRQLYYELLGKASEAEIAAPSHRRSGLDREQDVPRESTAELVPSTNEPKGGSL